MNIALPLAIDASESSDGSTPTPASLARAVCDPKTTMPASNEAAAILFVNSRMTILNPLSSPRSILRRPWCSALYQKRSKLTTVALWYPEFAAPPAPIAGAAESL
jgi:hypothetical protein